MKILEHWQEISSIFAIIGVLVVIIKVWRASGRQEGFYNTKIESHQAWLSGHENRLHALETKSFMTHKEHDLASERCIQGINKQIDDNHDNLAKLADILQRQETSRRQCRDEDNRRWTSFEVALARIQEFIEAQKNSKG